MYAITPKLYNWASVLDEGTKVQAMRTSRLDIVYPHVALMADAHVGIGATVGSVIPTRHAIIPAAIGVDIGCGMIALKTQFKLNDFKDEDLAKLRIALEKAIPSSAGGYNTSLTESAAERVANLLDHAKIDYAAFSPNWELQLGSLGSGNHFVEVTVDEDNSIWLFLHSGSRGIGNKIGVHHIKQAKSICKATLEDPDLAYLEEGTYPFENYIRDLHWAQLFAELNRDEMMDRLVTEVEKFLVADIEQIDRINCSHNFTQLEPHFGEDLWISRKGAISAMTGERGLVPGSMGTASYVVSGRGNPLSFYSSPHGAGRVHSRKSARAVFTLEDLKAAMGGIEFRVSDDYIDEIPGAYKDIDTVIKDSADLIDVVHEFHQIINVKGK